MIQHAKANNARLLKAYPKGFALDATHNPHVTLLQQFVRTADLDKVYAAANKALAGENPTSWKLKAFKYYYIPDPPIGLAGIVVEPTDDLRRLQQKIIDALAPFAVKTGTAAAFMSTEDGRDIQEILDRLRSQFCGDRSIWPEIQSARHNWCRHRSLPEGDARGTVRGVHVLASGSVGLPAWHFWYGSKGTQGLGVEALIGWGKSRRVGARIARFRLGNGKVELELQHEPFQAVAPIGRCARNRVGPCGAASQCWSGLTCSLPVTVFSRTDAGAERLPSLLERRRDEAGNHRLRRPRHARRRARFRASPPSASRSSTTTARCGRSIRCISSLLSRSTA